MRLVISQREARRLKKRVAELEREHENIWYEWRESYLPGTCIGTEPNATVEARTAIATARKLHCRVLAVAGGNVIRFYAKREKQP